MAFEISRFGSDSSNIKSILGGVNHYRYYNKDNNTLTTPGYFPSNLGLEVGDRIHVVPATKTDPDELYVVNTIVNGVITTKQIDTDGAVDSVNGKTGNVVLGANDVLPSQTGHSGEFLTTDGSSASWSDKPLVNTNPGTTSSLLIGNSGGTVSYIGQNAISITPMNNYSGWIALGANAIAIGTKSSEGTNSINIGGSSCDGNYAIQLGKGYNSDANTFKVGNNNGNFELMNANGNLPADRLASTSGLADGNYRLRLTMASGVPTLTWVAE